MSRAFICDHCERLYVSWRGFVDLLDMDNIQCRKGEKLTVVPIEVCTTCEDVVWEQETISADDWEVSVQEDIDVYQIRTEYEYYDS